MPINAPDPQAICALCREPSVLVESHIVPAFVYRWLKETSFTGYLRAGTNPRLRVQDGLKEPLLCARCEGVFNKWETAFANTIFYPYVADERLRAPYGDWLLKFCVSVSWRALTYISAKTGLRDWNDRQRAEADTALERWRDFMLGDAPHPGPYEQHLLPLSGIASTSISGLPKTINRYLMRAVEIDAAHGDRGAFSYAKMGRFALFGIVLPLSKRWSGTRVSVRSGLIKPSEYGLPYELLDYMNDRAVRYGELADAIPDHQSAKIEATVISDPARAVATDEFAAMLSDERMFGTDAILRKPRV